MKNLKVIAVLMLLSLQAGATGYSQNMFVAQKKLSENKESRSGKVDKAKKPEARATATVELDEEEDLYGKEAKKVAASVTQSISGWVIRLITNEIS